jgi:hypothetical protein
LHVHFIHWVRLLNESIREEEIEIAHKSTIATENLGSLWDILDRLHDHSSFLIVIEKLILDGVSMIVHISKRD